MLDYIALLKSDLIEQFRGKPNIEALIEVLGTELQEVYEFYVQLFSERSLQAAKGKQLDGIGDIVVLTRAEVAEITGKSSNDELVDDKTYRRYLIHKILMNTSDCSYPAIMRAFKMFWDRPIYFKEEPEHPATLFLDTGEMEGGVDTSPLFKTPLIKAAGVALRLTARTISETRNEYALVAGMGPTVMETVMPELI